MTTKGKKTLYFLPKDINVIDFGRINEKALKKTPQGFLIHYSAYQAWLNILTKLEKCNISMSQVVSDAGYISSSDLYNIQSTGLAVNLNFFSNKERVCEWFNENIEDVDWSWYSSGIVVYCQKANKKHELISLSKLVAGKWLRRPESESKLYKGFVTVAKNFNSDTVMVVRSLNVSSPGTTVRNIKRFNVSKDVVLLTDRENLDNKLSNPIFKVENINQAVESIIGGFRFNFQGKIITITGSVGKTSSTLTLSRILKNKGEVLTGIYNNLIDGVYKFGLQLKKQDFAVFEVAQGALPRVAETLDADVAVITNISESHMERHSSLEELALLKAEIFKSSKCSDSKVAVINRDIPYYKKVEKVALLNNRTVITYGKHPDSDFRLVSCNFSNFFFMYNGCMFKARKENYGEHLSINGIGSLAILQALNINWLDDLDRMSDWLSPPPGRGNKYSVVKNNKNLLVIDHAYNANPDSIKSCLVELSSYTLTSKTGRKIVILSDMLEMGDTSVQLHESIGKYFYGLDIDIVILCGDFISNLKRTIGQEFNVIEFSSLNFLFECLPSIICDGDILMFKGSNGTGLRAGLRKFISN
ncbi:Mur ligase family protein [Thiopseudomonas alkaliphila]|uniref:Mur ligase family protein n=1 Tax=Thiopseudomonas alkaliphila TaxID=1697053 RepID=UPI0025790FF0|nr:Mur ligase family protein [Thiopseudomonas alkaliphila]MDM1716468.1 hypothetical protein [Thiopseudomonas alkaliphila]